MQPDTGIGTSTRPYLVRALHEWCTDNGYTPYIAVFVDASVGVPTEYVKNNEIVLNVAYDATSDLKLGNDAIEFKARFGGTAREILVPMSHVIAIYARENGQGMAFPAPTSSGVRSSVNLVSGEEAAATSPEPAGHAHLTLTKGKPPKPSRTSAQARSRVDSKEPPESPSPGGPSLKRIK